LKRNFKMGNTDSRVSSQSMARTLMMRTSASALGLNLNPRSRERPYDTFSF